MALMRGLQLLLFGIFVWAMHGSGSLALQAADAKPASRTDAADYGPFVATDLVRRLAPELDKKGRTRYPTRSLARKALAIRLGKQAGACFDTATLTWRCFWQGDFIDLNQSMHGQVEGTKDAWIRGEPLFLLAGLAWAGPDGTFADPRASGLGVLPKNWGHYKGLFLHGRQVLVHYQIGQRLVWERVSPLGTGFCRQLTIAAGPELVMRVAEQQNPAIRCLGSVWKAVQADGSGPMQLRIPKREDTVHLTILYGETGDELPEEAVDLRSLCKGGPARWTVLSSQGRRAPDSSAYVVDDLPMPHDNPWGSWLRPASLRFFPDGRAVFGTVAGDIWIVEGIDAESKALRWRRFATGLYEPFGLQIDDAGRIIVRGRDQITRLHDLNADGEADFYENLFNDAALATFYHAFTYCLERDAEGGLLFATSGSGGRGISTQGSLLRLHPNGKELETIATGLRNCTGIITAADGQILVTDNQGEWKQANGLYTVNKGDFLGFQPMHHQAQAPKDYVRPAFWLPQQFDNSCAGLVFADSTRWGPLSGRLLHVSFGKCGLFLDCLQRLENGRMQGGAVRLKLRFSSGAMAAAVSPIDGQVYVVGLRGWGTTASSDGCFQRVRFTGQPVHMVTGMAAGKQRLVLRFSAALQPESVQVGAFALKQWTYRRSARYGSDLHDTKLQQVSAVQLADDKRTVTLTVPDLAPVDQVQIRFRLRAADGSRVMDSVYMTVHALPEELDLAELESLPRP